MTGGRGIVNIDTVNRMANNAANLANNAANVANNAANVANNAANVANKTSETVNAQAVVLDDIITNVKVSGDLSSVEQVNSLAGFFMRSISKINFAISCIDQYRKEINTEQKNKHDFILDEKASPPMFPHLILQMQEFDGIYLK